MKGQAMIKNVEYAQSYAPCSLSPCHDQA